MARIHVLLDDQDKARYQAQADREGKSLGAWLREAAAERLRAAETARRLATVDELRGFFDACDRRERQPEPDWGAHRRVIDDSQSAGLNAT